MESLVFLVGTDGQFLDALGARLSRAEINVLRTVNGDDVIKVAERRSVDLVITETKLAEMDAVNLCRQLRQRQILVPVLVCTDVEAPIEAVLVYEAGADHYFAKAMDWVVIEAKVRSVLRRFHRQRVAAIVSDTSTNRTSPCISTRLLSEVALHNLTRFEERLFGVLRLADGDVVPKPTIAAEIWGTSRVAGNSLYELVSSLRSKLHAAGWTIGNVRGTGYRLARYSKNARFNSVQ